MLASGAMSHGALVASAHEAVAHGINMVGAMSNCGEGGEHFSRYGTIRGSRIKQLASGRFGVWAGYLADPMLEELEIKIGQGAKPGEGGQLPGPKVTVDIAAARGAHAGRRAGLAAAAPRHVLDRGPRAAHPRLQGRGRAGRRQARLERGHRHHRGRRGQGGRGRHQRRRQHRRHRRRVGDQPEVRRPLGGAGHRRGAPGAVGQRAAAEGRPALLGGPPDGGRRRHLGPARRRQLRVRHHRADDAALRHGEELQHQVPGGDHHQLRGLRRRPAGARAVPAQHRPRGPRDPRRPRPAQPARRPRPDRSAGARRAPVAGRRARPVPDAGEAAGADHRRARLPAVRLRQRRRLRSTRSAPRWPGRRRDRAGAGGTSATTTSRVGGRVAVEHRADAQPRGRRRRRRRTPTPAGGASWPTAR